MYRKEPDFFSLLLSFLRSFVRKAEGAVTVDWVVLTAAIVGLGIAVLTSVGNPDASPSQITDEPIKTETLD